MSARRTLAITLAAGIAAGFSPAFGNPPSWAGHGQDKAGNPMEKHAGKHEERVQGQRRAAQPVPVGAFFTEQHRSGVRTYYATTHGTGKSCPPGLAKKNNGCLPPGQYRKLTAGERVPAGVTYDAVPRPVLVQLPPVPVGYRYVRVGNDIVLLSPQSALIVDVIRGVSG